MWGRQSTEHIGEETEEEEKGSHQTTVAFMVQQPPAAPVSMLKYCWAKY